MSSFEADEKKAWYVIQVYTGREEEILRQCRQRVAKAGEEVFVPMAERMTKVNGKWTLVETRLFSGYVFIVTDDPWDLYMRLKQIKAMTKLLKTGEEIIPLYREEEAYLKELLDGEYVARYSGGVFRRGSAGSYSGAFKGA